MGDPPFNANEPAAFGGKTSLQAVLAQGRKYPPYKAAFDARATTDHDHIERVPFGAVFRHSDLHRVLRQPVEMVRAKRAKAKN